jgi:hypothetical protein
LLFVDYYSFVIIVSVSAVCGAIGERRVARARNAKITLLAARLDAARRAADSNERANDARIDHNAMLRCVQSMSFARHMPRCRVPRRLSIRLSDFFLFCRSHFYFERLSCASHIVDINSPQPRALQHIYLVFCFINVYRLLLIDVAALPSKKRALVFFFFLKARFSKIRRRASTPQRSTNKTSSCLGQ